MKSCLLSLGLSVILLSGCQSTAPSSDRGAANSAATTTPSSPGPVTEGTFPLLVPGIGQSQVRVGDGGELTVGDWSTVWQTERVEVFEKGKLVAYGQTKGEERWTISAADGKRLAKLKAREDDGFKVVDAAEQTLCKVKGRDDGYKVTDSDEKTVLVKVKSEGQEVKVKDGNDKELARIEQCREPLAVTWLSINKLPVPVRLAAVGLTWEQK